MRMGARLDKLEAVNCSGLQIVIAYEGEAPKVSGDGLTVIIRKPGKRP